MCPRSQRLPDTVSAWSLTTLTTCTTFQLLWRSKWVSYSLLVLPYSGISRAPWWPGAFVMQRPFCKILVLPGGASGGHFSVLMIVVLSGGAPSGNFSALLIFVLPGGASSGHYSALMCMAWSLWSLVGSSKPKFLYLWRFGRGKLGGELEELCRRKVQCIELKFLDYIL